MKKKIKHASLFVITLVLMSGIGYLTYSVSGDNSTTNQTCPGPYCPNTTTNQTNGTGPGPGPGPICVPSPEICDNKDNDCDTLVDEGSVCGTSCTPNWQCTAYGTCTNNAQTRSCSDLNNCGSQIGKPATSQACTSSPPITSDYLTVSPAYSSTAASTCTNRAMSLATAPKSYETVLDAQYNTPNIIQMFDCSLGKCLWVPWYSGSKTNAQSDLKQSCGLSSYDYTHNCLVTDEFSQVGMETSLATNREQEMIAFANTVKLLKSPKYGNIPVWKAKRVDSAISDASGNADTASDATGRILIALYTGANNPSYSSGTKSMLKTLADSIAADQVKYEFTHVCKDTGKFGTICHFLASGGNTGTGGLSSNEYSYGGYHGDVALGMIAAYKSTGNSIYKNYAQDIARQYLVASHYDGSKFTVPPIRYNWVTSNGLLTSQCVSVNCGGPGGWTGDGSDQVRWVTMCKAQYMASLQGWTLNKDLGKYCEQGVNIAGYGPSCWARSFNQDGSIASGYNCQGGVMNNGLGASMNFYQKQGDLQLKINEIYNGHFGSGTNWDWNGVFGVYDHAFAVVSLGSAVGRDSGAFGSATGQYCT